MAKKSKSLKQGTKRGKKAKKPSIAEARRRKAKSNAKMERVLSRSLTNYERAAKRARKNTNGYFTKAGKRRTKTTGTSSRIKVQSRNAVYANKNLILKRKTTLLASKKYIKLSRNKSHKKEVLETLGKSAKKHFKVLGKSVKKRAYIKLKYRYTLKGKTYDSEFSTGISEIENESQLEDYIVNTTKAFESVLQSYLSSGFSNMSITGISVQKYENGEGKNGKTKVQGKTKSNRKTTTTRKVRNR